MIVYLSYQGFSNYQRSKQILDEQNRVWYSNNKFEFYKYTTTDEEYSYNVKFLDSLSIIHNRIKTHFLATSKDSVMFFPLDVDTIRIERLNSREFEYKSSLSVGRADKLFNDMLFNDLQIFLVRNKIDTAQVITITPTVYKKIPFSLPPGVLTNFDYE